MLQTLLEFPNYDLAAKNQVCVALGIRWFGCGARHCTMVRYLVAHLFYSILSIASSGRCFLHCC